MSALLHLWHSHNPHGVLWIFLAISGCDTSLYHSQGGITVLYR